MWVYEIAAAQKQRFLGHCVFRFVLDSLCFVFLTIIDYHQFRHLEEHEFVLPRQCLMIECSLQSLSCEYHYERPFPVFRLDRFLF